jgi:hypothetical protein
LLNGCEERIYRRNYDIHFVDLSIKGIFFWTFFFPIFSNFWFWHIWFFKLWPIKCLVIFKLLLSMSPSREQSSQVYIFLKFICSKLHFPFFNCWGFYERCMMHSYYVYLTNLISDWSESAGRDDWDNIRFANAEWNILIFNCQI